MHGTTVPLDTNKQQSVARLEALARLMDSRHHHPLRSRWHHRLDTGGGRRDRGSGIGLSHLGSPTARSTELVDCADARQYFPRQHDRRHPVVGDAFDVLFRANMKNMALLRRHLERKGYAQSERGTVIEGDAVRVS